LLAILQAGLDQEVDLRGGLSEVRVHRHAEAFGLERGGHLLILGTQLVQRQSVDEAALDLQVDVVAFDTAEGRFQLAALVVGPDAIDRIVSGLGRGCGRGFWRCLGSQTEKGESRNPKSIHGMSSVDVGRGNDADSAN